jgi:hypothetical protein
LFFFFILSCTEIFFSKLIFREFVLEFNFISYRSLLLRLLDETEELEREIFDMLQKIKRHNKKKIYNTTKDLYKLFKRDK